MGLCCWRRAVLARRVGETAQSHTPRFSLHGTPLLGFLEVTPLGNSGVKVLGLTLNAKSQRGKALPF